MTRRNSRACGSGFAGLRRLITTKSTQGGKGNSYSPSAVSGAARVSRPSETPVRQMQPCPAHRAHSTVHRSSVSRLVSSRWQHPGRAADRVCAPALSPRTKLCEHVRGGDFVNFCGWKHFCYGAVPVFGALKWPPSHRRTITCCVTQCRRCHLSDMSQSCTVVVTLFF